MKIEIFKTELGWRYRILLAGHPIREDGNYLEEADAIWAAERFVAGKQKLN
jgi:hypothetical protein